MTTTLLSILIVLAAGTLVLTFVLLIRGRSAAQGNLEQVLRAELRTAREESSSHARGLRNETDIWPRGAHMDSRTVNLQMEIHGDTLKFSDYNEVVHYVNRGDIERPGARQDRAEHDRHPQLFGGRSLGIESV